MSNASDFIIDNGVLKKYVGPGGDVVIPDGVAVICDRVFENCKLTSVSIPKSVKTIGMSAFRNAGMDQETIVLPEELEKIDMYAFSDNHFKSVRIPKNTRVMGDAFVGTEVIELYDSFKLSPYDIGGESIGKKYVIAVLSGKTDEVKFKVPMFYDRWDVDNGLRHMLKDAWKEKALVFDFKKFDDYFKKIKIPETKTAIAEFRINNPYSLSDEHKEMYASYLKRTQKKRNAAADDPARKCFEIRGNELVRFTGDNSVTEAIIPNGVRKIQYGAFKEKNSLKRIVIPDGVSLIESRFIGCSRTLESIRIPESLSGLSYHSFDELKQLKYNEFDDGLYLGNEKNPYVYFIDVKDRSITDIEIADGTKYIGRDAFRDCRFLKQIVLPDSIVRIEEQPEGTFTTSMRMNRPKGYLRTAEQLPTVTTLELLQTVWKGQIAFEDHIWIYLYQTKSDFEKISSAAISRNAERALDEILCALEKHPKPSAYKKAVKFAYQNKEQINRDKLQELYDGAQKEKVTSPEMDLLKPICDVKQTAAEDPAEMICRERFNAEEIDGILKKAKIKITQAIKKNPVHYLKSKKTVSTFVLQCVVAKYADLMQEDSLQPARIKEIDEIVASFDKNEFGSFVQEAGAYTLSLLGDATAITQSEKPKKTFGLIGRYGNTDMIRKICNAYDMPLDDYKGGWIWDDPLPIVNNWKRYMKAALLMSDLPEAREYCVSKGWTAEYAEIRGLMPYEVVEMAGMQLTPDERRITEAVALYEKWVSALNNLADADRTYNEPTVKEMPSMSPVSVNDPLVERFYAAIRDKYIEKGWTDLANDLYRWWTNATHIEDWHIGIEFTVGLLVASYMFVSKNVRGAIVFCRDKWEYRGDYSCATRLCLSVSKDASEWKAFMKTGYRVYDM